MILASTNDIRKYDDAIKWGCTRLGQALPSSYYREMEVFQAAYKKDHKAA